VEETKESVH
jgi:Icc-related predicted phosphoesterase